LDSTKALDEAESAAAAHSFDDAWTKLRTARKHANTLCSESLAFTEGALVRREGVDEGFCELADKLLRSLNDDARLNWRGFTILAPTTVYGEVSEVIRLRFPETTVWHLPIAFHEFGHFANPNITIRVRDGSYWSSEHPVETFLAERRKKDLKAWFHAHEYLADIFAVYVGGPAYAYTCLVLRGGAGALRTDHPNHPSWIDRYFLMLEALRRFAGQGAATQPIVADVEERWLASCEAAGGWREEDDARLREILDWFCPLLNDNLQGAGYRTFQRAQQLVPALTQDERPVLKDAQIPDVLNAAWLARLEDLDNVARSANIERHAVEACRSL
jgi:hypothetical protein